MDLFKNVAKPVADMFVVVALPIAVPKAYTYHVPKEMESRIQFGIRVEVQFGPGADLYAGLIIEVHFHKPDHDTKPVHQVIDSQPIILEQQLKFWQWLAHYYSCTIGEVMNAAMPANMKLVSETKICIRPDFASDGSQLDDNEFLVTEALSMQNELTVSDIQKIINRKSVYPVINQLLLKDVLYIKEELQERYKPRTVACVQLKEPYSEPGGIGQAFALVTRHDKQTSALLAFTELVRKQTDGNPIRGKEICDRANIEMSVLRSMEKKGIFEIFEQEVSRIAGYEDDLIEAQTLSDQQIAAITTLKKEFETKNVVLLHGVTGSGKTRVYTELIEEAIIKGEQILFLLPEIALTTQIIARLQKIFGTHISVYHSKLNNQERVELWKSALTGKSVILGARSSLFLPYRNLKLVIVDEEHDPSFKQQDPNPRYNARDASIYLANLYGAKVLLGTATPSVETYQNVKTGKYGLVEMLHRHGGMEMPEVFIVDIREDLKRKSMMANFTSKLIDELKGVLERKEQAILFQNRRGYSPALQCSTCGWNSQCKNCDVTLTYHKFSNSLNCHYCGYHRNLPKACPACASNALIIKGFGTERIEDELQVILPEARIARMDLDSVKSRSAHSKLIHEFEERRLDILVGTQMVTKGLDFDNVSLVGVLSADNLLRFPDFRAVERAFQLMTQVSGRAGRKNKRGKVLIQAFNVGHPVLQDIINADYVSFFNREIQERKNFMYPPYYRLIGVSLKHKKPEVLQDGARIFTRILQEKLGERVKGPALPQIPRVNTFYMLDYLIKIEKNANAIRLVKEAIAEATYQMQHTEGYSTMRVSVNVDPY